MKEFSIKLDESDLTSLAIGDIETIDSVVKKIMEQGEEQGYDLPDEYEI